MTQSAEGVGAVSLRNQVALFIASMYNTTLEYHGKMSEHGYDINKLFSKCPGPKLPTNNIDNRVTDHRCTLDTTQMYFPVCDFQDCQCMADGIRPHVDKLIAKGCSSIIVVNDGFRHSVFSGCVKPVLERYFGWKGPKPKWEYDVIHYRMGDLADRPGGKSFSRETVQTYVNVMCKTSKRDIVILTEGNPDVPQCENRVVLAADTSLEEAMQIMQYGKTVAVGQSGFARLMMMMANPEAVLVLRGLYHLFDWVDTDEWYLLESRFAIFHFKSKETLRKHLSIRQSLELFKFSNQRKIPMNFTKATRRWNANMMK